MYYLDTSILIPFYVPEKLSKKAEQFITKHRHLSISALTEIEFVSAVSKKVRTNEISLVDANRIVGLFQSHIEESYFLKFTLESNHYKHARDLLNRFDLTLNTLDALHISVSMLGKTTFITLDNSLYKAATSLGISTIDISSL